MRNLHKALVNTEYKRNFVGNIIPNREAPFNADLNVGRGSRCGYVAV